ncbi:MBL fold metallo-hydrolase [Flavobacterium sp. AC]|uniref:MBL fold metallo-hydrolase n=1 Tax=Flavobacterium azizsancarii TaxID=2961580 RepID=A0ABT4WGF4_9FLAO|nr:MBL fold metallo-hydrolase [Flavobacterium azizsancarii]MDA6071297.1 MBL fold metallo-hydrolase [Flavobacterium azizsancarii]
MKRLFKFLKKSPDRIAIAASAIGILLYLFLIPIWNNQGSEIAKFMAEDAVPDQPVKYGHYFVIIYFSLLIAIWSSRFVRQQFFKNGAILFIAIALSGNVLIYWTSEYLTIYARKIFFDYIEVPAIVILLLFFTLMVYKSKEQSSSNFKKYFYLVPIPLTLFFIILCQDIPLAAVITLLICILILSSNNQQTEKTDSKTKWYSITVKIIAIVLILISFAISFAIKYRPTNIVGENPEIQNEDFAKNSGIELYVFNTGFNRMAKALSPTYKKWRPCPIYLIKHPKFGYILFDSGISEKVALEGQSGLGFPMSFLFESKSKPEMLSFNQLKRFGVNPDEIKYLAISHLHDDHIGTVDAFKNAQLIMNGESKPKEGSLPEFKAASAFKESASVVGKSYDLFGDGTLQLIEKPGHTDSDLMILVNLDKGPVLLTGDAVVHADWLQSTDVERLPTQPEKAAQNRNNIRNLELKSPELIVFPGHDMPVIQKNRTDIFLVNPLFFTTAYLNIKN